MSRRSIKAAIFLGICILAIVVYYLIDPSHSAYMPKCIFHSTTGYSCPGCGSQRAIHALLHGNLREAFNYNALLVTLLPLLAFLAWVEYSRKKRPQLYMKVYGRYTAFLAIAILLLWMLLRNFFGI